MYTPLSTLKADHAWWVCFPGSSFARSGDSVIRCNQNLLVALSVISVAQPIDNWIDAAGDKREQCSRVVCLRIQLYFSRQCKHPEYLVWRVTND